MAGLIRLLMVMERERIRSVCGQPQWFYKPMERLSCQDGGYGPPDFYMARVNSNGFLDNTFGQGGKVGLPFSYSRGIGSERYYVFDGLAVQSDGKILVAGTIAISPNPGWNNDFAVARFNTDGTIDSTFGNNGLVTIDATGNNTNDEAYAVKVQPDGKILLAGYASYEAFAVIRFNTDGTIDNTFGSGGIASTGINAERWSVAMTIQPDGKILVAGSVRDTVTNKTDFSLVRFRTDGSLDNSFGVGGKVITDITGDDDTAYSLALQTDGKILVAGNSFGSLIDVRGGKFALVRYNSDGTLDNSWLSQTTVVNDGGTGISVAIQQDGKAIVAGASYTNSMVQEDFAMVRYNTDGTLDNTFGFGGIVTTDFDGLERGHVIAIQPDGKIVVGGIEDDDDVIAIARYLSRLNVGLVDFADQDKSVLIYPNPVQGEQVIEYTLAKDELLSIELYDDGGRLVKSFLTNQPRAKGSQKELLKFDESLPTGNYLLALTSGSKSVSIRVVKR